MWARLPREGAWESWVGLRRSLSGLYCSSLDGMDDSRYGEFDSGRIDQLKRALIVWIKRVNYSYKVRGDGLFELLYLCSTRERKLFPSV